MKFLLIGAAALALTVAGPAFAKDLTPAAPAMPSSPSSMWSGAFIGAHVGYGQADRNGCGDFGANFDILGYVLNVLPDPGPVSTCDGAPPDLTFDYTQAGTLFGIQGGYNFMPAEMFLIGLEGSISATNMTGELDPNNPFGGTGNWDSLLMGTAKVGVAAGSFLVYGEGGFAMGQATFKGNADCNFTMTHTGPVAGAGVSFKVNDAMSIDLKYDHIWFNAAPSSCNSVLLDTGLLNVNVPTELRQQGSADVVKLGLNFAIGHP